jgi:nucleotide-binding universal stress UspA family protein
MKAFRKILCPVDFSETSRNAFARALALARALDAPLFVLHVIGEVPLLSAYTGKPEASVLEEVEQFARKELDEMLSAVKLEDVEVASGIGRASEHEGSTDKAILAEAEAQGADLIVMGKHGRGRLDYLFFGSVTDRVIRQARIPVVVIPGVPPA